MKKIAIQIFFIIVCFSAGLTTASAAAPVLEITDSDGVTFKINRVFSRIITLYAAHTQNLLNMGLDEEIVGVCRSDDSGRERMRFSYRDDPERFLALRPDLVLIRPMISRGYPQLVKQLRATGVTVISLQPVTIAGMFDYWLTLGKLTGRRQQAREMAQDFTDQLAYIQNRVSEIPVTKRKHVYFEAIHGRMKTFAPASMAMFVLEQSGGINVANDAIRLRNTNIAGYGKERILARANEIDIFLAQQGRMNPVKLDDIINEPGFQVIKAVQEKQVYLVDEHLVSRPTMELLTGVRRISEILYPGLLSK